MRGAGTGTWYRWDTKDTTESQHRIDIRYLRKNGLLEPGSSGDLSWTRGGEETGRINYQVLDGGLLLTYRVRSHDGDWEPVEESVALTWTPCNFGGQRPWFICPIVGCGRRVAVLYGAGRYFGCRHCYDLTYQSRLEGIYERALRKKQRIMERLCGDPYKDFCLDKPKHMHWKTYNRLIEKVWQYDEIYEARVARMLMMLR